MDVQEEVRDLTIAEGRIGEVLLEKYDPKQFHVIVPTHVITIPEEVMELEVSVVHLSPNPKDMMVYPFPEAGPGMMALAKKGVEAISNAAGLTDEGTQEVTFVPGQYAIVKATVSATLPNGEVIRRTRSKNIDVDARMEEYEYGLRARIAEGKEKGFGRQGKDEPDEAFEIRREAYVQEKCTRRRHQLKKFLWELADTGAHLRAMHALLPSLKPLYHFSELRKPFIVPRISVKPAVTSNKLLAAAVRARARRDMYHLFGDQDLYEELPPELAAELREKDALLAQMADDLDDGQLLREALSLEAEEVVEGWELLQEAYGDDAAQAVEGEKPRSEWPARPWDPETLKRAMTKKVGGYGDQQGKPTDELLDVTWSSLAKVAPDAASCHVIVLYFFDTADLNAAQCSALVDWAGVKPPDYEPSTDAVEEARAIIRQCQAGQPR